MYPSPQSPEHTPTPPPGQDPWQASPISPYEVYQPPAQPNYVTVAPTITNQVNVHVPQRRRANKNLGTAYVIWAVLGIFGGHQFYLGRPGRGVLYLCTGGLLLIGWIADGITMSTQVRRINNRGW